ncbi:L-dopachrome tautomerase-related protein [Solimonas marina]|nr:L-dopachrome tautomerase-related protein [Solimonas marina]
MHRRQFCAALLMGAASLLADGPASAATHYDLAAGQPIQQFATLPWLCNALAITSDGRVFVGLPRWPGYEKTPSLAQLMPDGTLKPFPGGTWNDWAPGKPTANALVDVNTIHIFDDDTIWVVDQGAPFFGGIVDRDAHKILQFDSHTGKLLRKITLSPDVLPPGAALNDIRIDANYAYFTDSGAGAIVIVNLKTGKAIRRLAGDVSVKADPARPPITESGKPLMKADGTVLGVNSDPIEISPDGKWLYYQALTGPMYRVETKLLRDEKMSEAELSKHVQFVYDTPPLVGTAMDSAGNLYMAELGKPRITVLSPDGALRTLAEDDRLWGPDAMIITKNRELYVPIPQTARLAPLRGPGGKDAVQPPFKIYRIKLPSWLGNREKVPPVSH